jgi:hypothetical protein
MGLGEAIQGDETWAGDAPMIVRINRLQKTASLEFTYADGRHLSLEISFSTAEGLIKDLNFTLGEKGS